MYLFQNNIEYSSVLVFTTTNINKYNPYKQKLFRVLNNFDGTWDQKFWSWDQKFWKL